jgi:hypothetical protein
MRAPGPSANFKALTPAPLPEGEGFKTLETGTGSTR